MEDKGSVLNKRVWKLFERAGFITKPNSTSDTEFQILLSTNKFRTVDLYAEKKDLNIVIIGENKSGSLDHPCTAYVNDYMELMKISKANCVLFVFTDFKPNQGDINYARTNNTFIWGESDLLYYEALVDTIGEYAQYEIINSLGLQPQNCIPIENVLAIKILQPQALGGKPVFIFSLTPDILLKTCVVLRKAQGNDFAYQRIVQKNRLVNIQKFVSETNALLPTDIVVHFNDEVNWTPVPYPQFDNANNKITISRKINSELGILHIPTKFGSLELIDGQHRLYGFINTDVNVRDQFNLIIAGLSGINEDQRVATFVSINDKARRMDANLVAFLKFTPDENICICDPEKMAIKIVHNLNEDGTFQKRIRMFDINRKEKITLKGFAGYELKSMLGPSGILRKYYNNSSVEFIKLLRLYFSIIKTNFYNEWKDPNKYIIFQNRGISAFLKLLKSILKYYKKPVDTTEITEIIVALRKSTNDEFWEVGKLKNSYVGSQGWSNFHRDIVKEIQKQIPNFRE